MVQKQQKQFEALDFEMRTHYPYICEKSRQIASERTLNDLLAESLKPKLRKDEQNKVAEFKQGTKELAEEFLKRNYDEEKEKRI
jgi:phage terminase Nu1 subunit (DNA packaging protein)